MKSVSKVFFGLLLLVSMSLCGGGIVKKKSFTFSNPFSAILKQIFKSSKIKQDDSSNKSLSPSIGQDYVPGLPISQQNALTKTITDDEGIVNDDSDAKPNFFLSLKEYNSRESTGFSAESKNISVKEEN